MSLERENLYVPNDFINLKNRVKAEMNRRNGNGSLTSYGSSTYDYSKQPLTDETVDIEHYSKVRELQAKINPSGLQTTKESDDLIEDMTVLEAKQIVFEAQPRGARSNNDCNSACTGMCISTCSTGCTSCTGCSGCSSCSGSCSGCSGGCSGCSGCGGACSSSCSGSCSGCSGSCSGCSGCSGGCTSCTNVCSSHCTGCSGCTSNCSGYCQAQCRQAT